MSATDPPGGLPPELFDAVDDFVARIRTVPLDGDCDLSGSHTLVVLVESALEAFSVAQLGLQLVGLKTATMEALTMARRTLEQSNDRPALQLAILAFEEVCDVVRDALYGGASTDLTSQFFELYFPDWLSALGSWATGEKLDELAKRIGAARSSYGSLAFGWWGSDEPSH